VSKTSEGRAGPPPVPFVLSVGVTGHRADVLSEGSIPVLRDRIRDVLVLIEHAGRSLLERERDCFANEECRLRFISPVADGADQIAAEVALELGWQLQAVVPFAKAEYRASLANAARASDSTLCSIARRACSSCPVIRRTVSTPM